MLMMKVMVVELIVLMMKVDGSGIDSAYDNFYGNGIGSAYGES